MAMVFIGSFVVGLLASFFLPVTLFVSVLLGAMLGSLVPIMFGRTSVWSYALAVASGIVLAQIGYVAGLTVQAYFVRAALGSRLRASLRDFILHRRGS